MIKQEPDKQKINRAVYVQFDKLPPQEDCKESSKAGKRSSTKPEKSAEPKRQEKPNPPTKATPTPDPQPENKPKPKPTPTPKVKPLPTTSNLTKRNVSLTTPEREIAFAPMLEDISETAKVEEVSDEVLEVTEEMSADAMDDISKYFKNKNTGPASGDDADGQTSNDSEAGEGDQGTSEAGDSNSDGTGEFGTDGAGDGFDGDGLLTRNVVYHADMTELIKQNGKIVVNVCVNREGKVIFAKADRKSSSLKDPAILKAAEVTMRKYRYEKDYSVSERQCSRLSFIIKIEEE